MTHPMDPSAGPIASGGAPFADQPSGDAERPAGVSSSDVGPDPVSGAGIALFGIFLMGTGGALEAHYVFDVGVGVAMIGAAIFTLFVALSALKQRLVPPSEPAPPSA